jgi:hypothetical protein
MWQWPVSAHVRVRGVAARLALGQVAVQIGAVAQVSEGLAADLLLGTVQATGGATGEPAGLLLTSETGRLGWRADARLRLRAVLVQTQIGRVAWQTAAIVAVRGLAAEVAIARLRVPRPSDRAAAWQRDRDDEDALTALGEL